MGRSRLIHALMTVASTLGIAAPSALADTVASSNWAGYAVHRPGVRFSRVSASWTLPSANCTAGHRTYSAMWVGLGGYSAGSNAIEQIGTEVDCTASGRVASSVWYELVPAPSRPVKMKVRPGDQISASATVSGNRVVLALQDATTHHSFTRTFRPKAVDVSSAEWILEAPSECISYNSCRTLPLANFGSASVGLSRVRAVGGHSGAISDRFWDSTQIKLTPGGMRFITFNGDRSRAAIPSALNPQGNGFSVTFATIVQQQARRIAATAAALPRAGVHVAPLSART
jgi:hypothetical protein